MQEPEVKELNLNQPEPQPSELNATVTESLEDVKTCPNCKADLSDKSAIIVKTFGRTIKFKGKSFKSVMAYCGSCKASLGFSGITPVKGQYTEARNYEQKRKASQKRQKLSRKKNR